MKNLRLFIAILALMLFVGTGVAIAYQGSCGTNCYAIDRANIATTSVNLSFGFSANTILVVADGGNADDICVNWSGFTATCPSANTAGNKRLSAGQSISLNKEEWSGKSISVIGDSSCSACIINVFVLKK